MRRRIRIRGILKWTGAAACALIVAAWGVSQFWIVHYGTAARFKFVLNRGCVNASYYSGSYEDARLMMRITLLSGLRIEGYGGEFRGLQPGSWPWWHRLRRHLGIVRPDVAAPSIAFRSDGGRVLMGATAAVPSTQGVIARHPVTIPLWMLFVPCAALTFLLYRRDRSHLPHCCAACGYNLTGVQSAVCPECGAPAPNRTSAAPIETGRGISPPDTSARS